MANRQLIRVADLAIDELNPRITTPNNGQRDAARNIATHQDTRLYALAKDIVENGLSPIDLLLVMPKAGERNRFVVIEGNRRLAAVKCLESPDLLDGAVPDALLKKMRALSTQYLEDPVDEVECIVVPDRESSQHWVELRHTGQNDGAGTVDWGSDEKSRYRARLGNIEPHRALLDKLVNDGLLAPHDVDSLKTTNFRRLIATPEVREKLGFDIRNKAVFLKADWEAVGKALAFVVKDLNERELTVGDIYSIKQRIRYVRKLPKEIVITNVFPNGSEIPLGSASRTPIAATPARARRAVRPAPKRKGLIPRDASLMITDARISAIEIELRNLDIEAFANAVSVLFRVFVELSVDAYIDREGLQIPADPKLRAKLNCVVQHLVSEKKLTGQQARPIRAAAQANSYLAASVTTMNDYVHNAAMSPSPTDLRSAWDSFQAFMSALWSK